MTDSKFFKIVKGPTTKELQASLFDGEQVVFVDANNAIFVGIVEGLVVGDRERELWIIDKFYDVEVDHYLDGVYSTSNGESGFGELSLTEE